MTQIREQLERILDAFRKRCQHVAEAESWEKPIGFEEARHQLEELFESYAATREAEGRIEELKDLMSHIHGEGDPSVRWEWELENDPALIYIQKRLATLEGGKE